MNVQTARAFVQQFGRTPSGDTSVYDLSDIDRAIQAVCDDWLEHTKSTQSLINVAISQNNAAINLGAPFAAAGGLTHNLIDAWVNDTDGTGGTPLNIISIQQIKQYHDGTPANTGRPTEIGFATLEGLGALWPTPDQNYNADIRFHPILVTTGWTVGGSDGTTLAVVINISDHYLRTILMYGATAILQHTDIAQRFASESWQAYLMFRESIASKKVWTQAVRSTKRNMILES